MNGWVGRSKSLPLTFSVSVDMSTMRSASIGLVLSADAPVRQVIGNLALAVCSGRDRYNSQNCQARPVPRGPFERIIFAGQQLQQLIPKRAVLLKPKAVKSHAVDEVVDRQFFGITYLARRSVRLRIETRTNELTGRVPWQQVGCAT